MTRAILTALLLCSTALPAFAQSRAELAAQNEQLRQRIERLEARMLTGDPAAERLMARIDTLETTLRTLRGELEQMRYERDQKESEVAALEGDIRELQALATRTKIHLDAVDLVAAEQGQRPGPSVDDSYVAGPPTISAIPSAPVSRTEPFQLPPASSDLPPATPNDSNDATQLGEIGIRRLEEGDYAGAEQALSQYLQFNPGAQDTDIIHYWLGEARYVRGLFNGAAESYIASMRAAPQGTKAPDALVKLAASLREVGQVSEACNALASFSGQFPNASQIARDKAAREAARTGC
jgi:tol-pal system protein YbgF